MVVGALIGGIGSIIGGMMNNSAQQDMQNSKLLFDYYNLRQQKNARRDSQDFAQSVIDDQKLGGSDAMGNRTYFDELKGWMVDKSDQTKDLEGYFYGSELPEMRSQFDRQSNKSKQYDLATDGLLDQFNRATREDPAALENILYAAQTRGIGDATREQTENSSRLARQRGQTIDPNAGDIASSNMEARANARVDSKLKAMGYTDGKYEQERGSTAQLIQAFEQMANKGLDPTLDAMAVGDQANRNLSPMMQILQQGNAQGFNSHMKDPPTLNPDLQAGNFDFIGKAAGQFGQGINAMAAQGREQQGNNLMMDYMTMGNQLDPNRGGMFAAMLDRSMGSNQGGRKVF